MTDNNVKNTVRAFYDQVGWQMVDKDMYQNAQYEDLRPVSQEYIHRCHMRVKRHLAPEGRYLLDAGSGPVQYPQYLTYSEGYHARVCMDISILALKEARKRLGDHGYYVVADVAQLPFKAESFDGIVSLHTIHHVPMVDKLLAYEGLYRTLVPGKQMVIVNGWTNSPLTNRLSRFMRFMARLRQWWEVKVKHRQDFPTQGTQAGASIDTRPNTESGIPAGTFVQKENAQWLADTLGDSMAYDILVWRSVSVSFLRSVIYPDWGGRFWLKVLYFVEELFPRFLGRVGQYPLIVINKPEGENKMPESPSTV